MRKIFALCLSLFLLMGALSPALAQGYTPGTYEVKAQGHNAEMTVSVLFSDDRIEEVTVLEHEETKGISDPALENIPQAIIANQSLAVETISGATITSKAILTAVATAVEQAGGDVASLQKLPTQQEEALLPEETLEADVVVIGAGGAGLAAAIQAKDSGAKSVMLLEKRAAIGGTTFISQGVIAGYQTKIAKAQQIDLSYEQMYDNLMRNASYRLDPTLTKITVERSGETVDWLAERLQVPFLEEVRVGYGPLQMMHAIDGMGEGLRAPFEKALDELGVDLRLETRATALLQDADGGIVGVLAHKGNQPLRISAKAVVIATGGYANNPELTVLLNPEMAGTFGIGFPAATGDGLIMASNAGAALTHTDHLMSVLKDYEIMAEHDGNSMTANVSRFIASPNLVLVGQNAKRFVDEKSGGYMTQELNRPIFDQMHRDGVGYVWAITDTASQEALKFVRGKEMAFISADTAEELAEQMNLDPKALAETLENYNQYVADGHDPDFGRLSLAPLTAPYLAVKVVPCEIITYGGIARNVEAEVIRADGSIIPGLYVAGEASANSAYMGFTLSNCFTWGRIAGENAAAFSLK